MALWQALQQALSRQHKTAVQDGDSSAYIGPQLLSMVRGIRLDGNEIRPHARQASSA
jgi:hypothetical protein